MQITALYLSLVSFLKNSIILQDKKCDVLQIIHLTDDVAEQIIHVIKINMNTLQTLTLDEHLHYLLLK